MATVKHIKIYNANYDAACDYLTMQHNEFTNKPILNEHGEMIPREFYLLDGINCDPYSFSQECQAVNAHFGKNHTYREIKAHHYIVSFDPRDKDENKLTPEHAQELGMEIARKAFPGHQAIVCTHRDGHNSAGNIHCHILINSVRKLQVEKPDFLERPGDCLAGNKHHASDQFLRYFKQTTMEICQREGLYQTDLLSPAKVRITDREYWAQRRGQKALDLQNEAVVRDGRQPAVTVFETDKMVLRRQITSVMNDSHDMEEFRKKLLELYGIQTNVSRGRISFLTPDRSKPIRGSKLGSAFEKEAIEASISQNRTRTEVPDPLIDRMDLSSPIRLIVDIKACIKAQENSRYAQKVKVTNLQQAALTLAFLQENQIGTREELSALLTSVQKDLQDKKAQLQSAESRLKTVNQMIHYTGQYLSHKDVYRAFTHAENKQKFRREHESEILLYEAARKELKRLSGGGKLQSLKQMQTEKAGLRKAINELYEDYSMTRSKSVQLQKICANVDLILEVHRKVPGDIHHELPER